jgi:hypothetical protein
MHWAGSSLSVLLLFDNFLENISIRFSSNSCSTPIVPSNPYMSMTLLATCKSLTFAYHKTPLALLACSRRMWRIAFEAFTKTKKIRALHKSRREEVYAVGQIRAYVFQIRFHISYIGIRDDRGAEMFRG